MELSKDEIIRMARDAGISSVWAEASTRQLERFAALAAEPWIKTNKALANEIIELKKQVDISALPIIIEAAVKEAVLAEREACAKVCETDELCCKCGDECAASIRARGETK